MKVTDLRCEYATNPIGLDVPAPQFSWRIESDKKMVLQGGYRILVSDSPEQLAKDSGNVWDSGPQHSSRSCGIVYQGKELESRKSYCWKVKVWDSHEAASGWSEPASFEMGLTRQEDWKGDWVGMMPGWSGKPLYFKRTFHVGKPLRQARLYISAIGYGSIELNGAKVGDHVLDPAMSEYAKRVYYTTYDVAKYLRTDNVMLITVGQGWYGIPKLRLQMELAYDDGTFETITSTDVRNVATGPIQASSIYDGEVYDARLENSDLRTTAPITVQNRQWSVAQIADPPGGKMVAQKLEPIKVVDTLLPRSITEPLPGVYVVDSGQNLAGWASLRVKGNRGSVITLKFAETLYDNGTVNQENLRAAQATDTYILKGGVEETWEPSFTYHGFRYIQIEGFPYRPDTGSIQIRVVRSAVNQTGRFSCSNELLNRIHGMVVATEASNLHGVPTDCPQRDERMGWMNDLTVRMEEALYNFDLSRFYAKFIDDVADTQGKDGTITCTAPFRYGSRPADPVSASYLLLALKSYQFYGNQSILRTHYDGMKAWVDYLASRTENGIVNYSYYGDWSPPAEFGVNGSAIPKNTPGQFISTGYLYYCARMLSQMAAVLGKSDDASAYAALADKTATALNGKYWDEKAGGYATNNQSCNSFALFLGLVAKENI
ncbi:MAG TPA: family 78 glycoside hydrolase catalytic domain, partial [Chloroflexota bacterium]|nr:family 78 glycoside hydrolase catalytic domain [Chloroflexota bacterium]